ncbi:MAG: cell division protein FtsQ, partial [Deltaproteobacteria bacterium]|nr:cell division protein FtsQ [Deltaproteobacteria bacterium]
LITGISEERLLTSRKVDSPSLHSALEVLKLMQDLKVTWLSEVLEISCENHENIVLYNKNRGREIRLGLNNLQEKVIYLQTIWDDIETRVSGIEYIDLRYKNQIIVKPENHIM